MKMRIPMWIKIVVLVPTVLFLTGYSYMKYSRWNILQEQKEFIRAHGQECIESAVPIGDGHAFALCRGKEIAQGLVGDSYGTSLIVYDSSGQISLPSEMRSDFWNFTILSHYYGWSRHTLRGENIEGSFYLMYFFEEGYGPYTDPDPVLADFIKRHECDFVNLIFSCKKEPSNSKSGR